MEEHLHLKIKLFGNTQIIPLIVQASCQAKEIIVLLEPTIYMNQNPILLHNGKILNLYLSLASQNIKNNSVIIIYRKVSHNFSTSILHIIDESQSAEITPSYCKIGSLFCEFLRIKDSEINREFDDECISSIDEADILSHIIQKEIAKDHIVIMKFATVLNETPQNISTAPLPPLMPEMTTKIKKPQVTKDLRTCEQAGEYFHEQISSWNW
ncbi:hypothetical protein TRFO_07301 [Tritrichomonas foetus]|uniref:Ubiquitin-like domain-containing protein n=1 Tax=Tritrichomonas foetus TaxID=1144522 RepID=A0A1J4JSI8_9EUKA|nr:hypothetical protein TRFO_07301 [Tritrichomonas foetus]|eukprot:OHT02103.1 hypothetical protein TRFO_07301 [Tritrichomonas foetus]